MGWISFGDKKKFIHLIDQPKYVCGLFLLVELSDIHKHFRTWTQMNAIIVDILCVCGSIGSKSSPSLIL